MSREILSACACIGEIYGEPYCPCEMNRRGLPSSPAHIAANEEAQRRMSDLFAPGGPFHKPADNEKDGAQ